MLRNHMKLFLYLIGLLFSFSAFAGNSTVNTLLHNPNDPVAGNPNGKVTVVEFFDYQCSHCVNMAATIASLIKNNPNVRIVFKDYPIRGPFSEFAARAALAANKQGKYYQFNHALLTSNSGLTESNVYEIAKSVGLDVNRLKKDMKSSSINRVLKSNMSQARQFNVSGTPAFFIGKTDAKNPSEVNFVLGEMSLSELQTAIDKANAN